MRPLTKKEQLIRLRICSDLLGRDIRKVEQGKTNLFEFMKQFLDEYESMTIEEKLRHINNVYADDLDEDRRNYFLKYINNEHV